MAERRRVPVTVVGRRGEVGGVVVGPQEAQQRRIETILRQACTNGVLRLANRGLAEIPREVFFLHEMSYQDKRWWEEQQLTTFDVSHNHLTSVEVPTEASSNSRDSGPNPLDAFSSLRLITAAYNQLRSYPRALVACCAQTLTKLDLSHNRLVELPFSSAVPPRASATALTAGAVFPSLLELDMSHNELASLDVSVSCTFPSLEKLNVSYNRVRRWEGSEKPGALRCLRELHISHNRMEALVWMKGVDTSAAVPSEDRLVVSQVFPVLKYLDASYNELVALCPPPAPPFTHASSSDSVSVFPPTLVTLNLKCNHLAMWPADRIGRLPSLKELYLGNNQFSSDAIPTASCVASTGPSATPREQSLEFSEGQCPSLEMLDVSNNRLCDVRGVLLPLRSSLSRVDLSNNNISSLPPELGRFPKMTAVVLDGNPLRSIRRDVVARGTQELLAFLRDRDSSTAVGSATTPDSRVAALPRVVAPPSSADVLATSRVAADRPPGKIDDRPFATEWNCERRSAETKLVEDACVRGGEHAGGLWDLSWRNLRTQRVTQPCGSAQKTSSRGAPVGSGGAGAAGQPLRLPPIVDSSLNLSELHHSAEQRFRDLVHTVRFDAQPDITALSLSFVGCFPKLREVSCAGCSQLCSVTFPGKPEELAFVAVSAFSSLGAVDFSHCAFRTTDVATTASTLDSLFNAFAQHGVPISRLNLSGNPQLRALPRAVTHLNRSLQYLRLDGNPQFGSHRDLFPVLHSLHELLELSLVKCGLTEIPADGDAAVDAVSPAEQGTKSHVLALGFCEASWPKLLSLDVSYNDLRTVPPSLGRMRNHLRALNLEGNAIRWLRSECVAKGTAFVLQYLFDKLPLDSGASPP